MKRRAAVLAAAVALAAAAWWLFLRGDHVEPRLVQTKPIATIGSGSGAVGVAGDGTVLSWLPAPEDGSLPRLPLTEPPPGGRLAGPALQQARVLGAAPAGLRPYIESSFYGDSGVDVVLKAGVQLRFGSASQATKKWRAAAAVLADPTVTTLDYVDLYVPGRPTFGGSGHSLPAVP